MLLTLRMLLSACPYLSPGLSVPLSLCLRSLEFFLCGLFGIDSGCFRLALFFQLIVAHRSSMGFGRSRLNLGNDALGVGLAARWFVATGEHRFGMELAGFVQRPDFLSVMSVVQPGVKPAEVVLEILNVP